MDGTYLKDELYAKIQHDPDLFEFIQSGSLDGMWYWDLEHPEHEWISPKFWQTFGYDPSAKKHLASEWQDMIFKEDLALALVNFHNHCDNPAHPYDQIVRYRHKSGSTVWVRCRGLAIRDSAGKAIRMLGAHTDLTALKNAEFAQQKIANERSELALILNSASDGIYKVDTGGLVTYINPAALKILEFTESDVLWKHFHQLVQYSNASAEPNPYKNSPVFRTIEQRVPTVTPTDVYWTKRGKRLCIESKASPLLAGDKVIGAVVVFRDITAEIKSKQKLAYLAHHDLLTRLPNRAYCIEYLETSLVRASRKQLQVALLFIDLDNFKDINDIYGHDAGDQLLAAIALRLQQNLRKSDFVARLGGDEFVVLIEDVTDHEQVNDIASNLLHKISKPTNIKGAATQTSCSIGIAVYPGNGTTVSDLMRYADQAMYQSKIQGRNRYHWFSEEINRRFVRENYIRQHLAIALDNKQLSVAYQPIWNKDIQLEGFEALCRWSHDGKEIPPAEFIPVAEKSRLIAALGDYVFESAVTSLHDWREKYQFKGYIAVNVSLSQLRDFQFIQHVSHRLKMLQIPFSQLILEVTESTLVENFTNYASTFDLITREGITLALDDFGTGYASFRHLHHMPVKYLKIDQSFIQNVPEDNDAANTIAMMLSLGRSLKLGVIVEGVERPEQAQWLDDYSCNQQGFLYARPANRHVCEQQYLVGQV